MGKDGVVYSTSPVYPGETGSTTLTGSGITPGSGGGITVAGFTITGGTSLGGGADPVSRRLPIYDARNGGFGESSGLRNIHYGNGNTH